MSRRGHFGALAALLSALAGCAALLGIDQDYQEVADAAADVSEATTPEAGGDSSVREAAADAPTDTRPDEGGDAPIADSSTEAAPDAADALDAPALDGSTYSPLSPGDLRLYYASSAGDVSFRTWSHASQRWAPPITIAQYPATLVPWTQPGLAPSSGAEIVGVYGVEPDSGTFLTALLGQNGWPVTWSSPNTSPATQSAHRGFDVTYETASGDTVLVYADGTSAPQFVKEHAGAWTSPRPILSTGVAGVDWVRMVSHPATNEITLVYTDTSRFLYGAVWNGTSWSSATQLDPTGLNVSDFAAFGAAYENVTGNLLVAWSRPSSCAATASNPIYFATKPSGGVTFSAVATSSGLVGAPGPMLFASEPGTNRIAFSSVEYCASCAATGCNHFNVGSWDTGAWLSIAALDNNIGIDYAVRPGSFPVAVGWLTATHEAVAVYSRQPGSTLSWATWTTTAGWQLQPPATMTPPLAPQANFAMVRIPPLAGASDALVLVIEDTFGTLWGKLFDGTTWSDTNGGASLATVVGVSEGLPLGLVVR